MSIYIYIQHISKTCMLKHFLPLFTSQTEIPKQLGSKHQPEEKHPDLNHQQVWLLG